MKSAGDIAKDLTQRVEQVAHYLLPNGQRKGHEWCVGSINGEAGKSLKVCLDGSKKGVWADFADNHSGDLLDLWMLTRRISCVEAISEASQWLGIDRPSFKAHKLKSFRKLDNNTLTSLQESSPVLLYLQNQRHLSLKTLKAFRIAEKNNFIVFPYFRDEALLQKKYLSIIRKENKKQIHVERDCQPCLFGWHVISNNERQITLTEGELDAMSLYQYGISALSLPFGGGQGDKHQWLDYEFDRLSVYDKIYLCFDNDETGWQTVHALIERLGRHRCYVVTLPYKDANACLQHGIEQAIIQKCFQEASTYDPEELRSASVYVTEVIKAFYLETKDMKGYLPPWNKAKSFIDFRTHEFSVWTGINGHGKSQFLGFLLLHAMQQGAKVCIASLEIKPERLLMRLTRQVAGCELPSREAITAIHQWYADKLWLFDLVGTAKTERLLEVFLYARQRYGVDVFLIDSLLKCHIAEDDFNAQKQFVEQLCDFKNEHPCHVHLIAHPRKGADEKQEPGKLDIKGSGSISDLADNCFSIWRNKEKEIAMHDAELTSRPPRATIASQADCIWSCDKQRNGDWEGKFALWFSRKAYHYLDHPKAKAIPIVQSIQEEHTE